MPAKAKKQINAGLDALAFGTDAAAVIAMRCARIAKGGEAGITEAQLMVTEKVAAFVHTQWGLLTGAYGTTPNSMFRGVMNHYAQGVRANRQRLSSKNRRSSNRRAT